jgi:hypothetical protein
VLTGIEAAPELTAPVERALNSHGLQTIALDAPGTGESSPYPRPALAVAAAPTHPRARRRRRPDRSRDQRTHPQPAHPTGPAEIIRGGGHLFLLERPTEHAARIAAFLTAGEGDDVARPAQDTKTFAPRND